MRISPLLALFFISSTSFSQKIFYNVKDFGAKGDGKNLDSKAINKAIETCTKSGGGTVEIPAGTYLCGSIHLANNINLHLKAGATILGAPQNINAYDTSEAFNAPAYQDGGHTYFHNSLIWGENLKNVSITGQGMINGGGLAREDKEITGPTGRGSIGLADKAIALKLCANVLIRDIVIYHGGHFAILVTGCDLVTIDNVTIDTNRDGIDLDCCTNTMVSNCRINSPYDDALCPKSSYALNRPVVTENLVITNCEVSGFEEGTLLNGKRIPVKGGWSKGRIKFGTESNGGFRNCAISNCIFRSSNGLALEEVDGGIMENISISNLTMTDIAHYPIYITLGNRNRGPQGTKTGVVRNIHISDIVASGVDSFSGIQVTGVPGSYIENISLQNIYITYLGGGTKAVADKDFPELDKGYPEPYLLGANPAYGIFARHVKDLQLFNINFNTEQPDQRPAIICNDVVGLDIDHFKAPANNGSPAYRFNDVENERIANAPLLEDAKK